MDKLPPLCVDAILSSLSPSELAALSPVNKSFARLVTPRVLPRLLDTIGVKFEGAIKKGIAVMQSLLRDPSLKGHVHGFLVRKRGGVTCATRRIRFDPHLPPLWLDLRIERFDHVRVVATVDHRRSRLYPVFEISRSLLPVREDPPGRVVLEAVIKHEDPETQRIRALENLEQLYPHANAICYILATTWNAHKDSLVPSVLTADMPPDESGVPPDSSGASSGVPAVTGAA